MKQPTPTYLAAAVAAFNLVTRNSLSERDAALFMHLADTARERHASPPISRLEPDDKAVAEDSPKEPGNVDPSPLQSAKRLASPPDYNEPSMPVKHETKPVDFERLLDSVPAKPRPIINQHTVIMPRHPVKAVDLPNTDALVDPTGRPRWDDVPAWIKWLAQNRRGVWKGFASKPEAKCGDWVSTKRFAEINSGTPLIGQDWISTLEPRP